jgi:ankyrin repeat protein
LHWAAYHGHLAIAKRLLEGGADATLRDYAGRTAIDNARSEGKSEVVALLSEPRCADEEQTMNATATQPPRRLGHTPSADGWPTANKRRRLAMGCGREDACLA